MDSQAQHPIARRRPEAGGPARWARDESGVAALEFGLVALPFVMILFAILEAGLFFYRATLFETAIHDATRQIRTGEIHEAGDPEQVFRDSLCAAVMMVACEDIQIHVEAYPDFASARTDPVEIDSEGDLVEQGFTIGAANSVMVAHAGYPFTFMTPLVGTLFAGSPDMTFTLTASAVFRNEPYDF